MQSFCMSLLTIFIIISGTRANKSLDEVAFFFDDDLLKNMTQEVAQLRDELVNHVKLHERTMLNLETKLQLLESHISQIRIESIAKADIAALQTHLLNLQQQQLELNKSLFEQQQMATKNIDDQFKILAHDLKSILLEETKNSNAKFSDVYLNITRMQTQTVKDVQAISRIENELAYQKHFLQQNNQVALSSQERLLHMITNISQELAPKPSISAPVLPTSCAEMMNSNTDKEGGLYELSIPSSLLKPFKVYCLKDPDNGKAWTVVQRRLDGTTNFYRGWQEYKHGFGNMEHEFWLGLEQLHALTMHAQPQELWIQMKDWKGNERYAKYKNVWIDTESAKYALIGLGEYYGDAGDSLKPHLGQKFTTLDSDNDDSPGTNCAKHTMGAWWYHKCHHSNLNGQYCQNTTCNNPKIYGKGLHWMSWYINNVSLKYVHMAIRPVTVD